VGDCFCGGVDFLIPLNASVAVNPDKGDGDIDGGESGECGCADGCE